MQISRGKPWVCLGLGVIWLLLNLQSQRGPQGIPSLAALVFSCAVMYVFFFLTVFFTAGTVSDKNRERIGSFKRACRTLKSDIFNGHLPDLKKVCRAVAFGFLFWIISICASWAIGLLLQKAGLPADPQPIIDIFKNSAISGKLSILISVVIFTPVTEELLFRYTFESVVYGITGNRMKSILYGALFFAGMHFNLVAFIPLIAVSIGCSYLFRKSGSILLPMIAHAVFNFSSVVCLLCGLG